MYWLSGLSFIQLNSIAKITTTLLAGARLKDQRRWVDVQNKQANKKGHHKLSQNNHVTEKTTQASGRN